MSIDFKIEEDFDGLNKLMKNAEKIKQQGGIPFTDIFSDSFFQNHTDFESLDDLFEKAGFTVKSEEDLEAVPQDELDLFIKNNTKFEDFNNLREEAIAEYFRIQLLNGLK